MMRALRLARRGLGRVSPNPPVGAVAVRAGRIVGEGWHRAFGAPHAEADLIARAGDVRGTDIYVTLEPCAHHGKTPPCSTALIAAGVRRVFYAVPDPNPVTHGRGPAELREAGIDVRAGLCEEEARYLIAPYVRLTTAGVPLVTAKWAMTADGRIASRTGSSRWISSAVTRSRTRRERRVYDAILVGRGTLEKDDPRLLATSRKRGGPLRVLLDSNLALKPRHALLEDLESVPLLVLTALHPASPQEHARRREALARRGVEVVGVRSNSRGLDLSAVLRLLGKRGIASLLVEGGAHVHGAFFDRGLVDRVQVIVAPIVIGGAEAPGPVGGKGRARMDAVARILQPRIRRSGEDILLEGALSAAGRGDWPPAPGGC